MLRNIETVSVGGLLVTPLDGPTEAAELLLSDGKIAPGLAVALNAEKVVASQRDPELRRLLSKATLLYADGISIVHTIRSKGTPNQRVPGCELWEALMREAARQGLSVYLLGASEATNLAAFHKLQEVYGLTNIARRNGYFSKESDVVNDLITLKPDIVTVAMGSPKQERLIDALRKHYPHAFYMGVGGSYDVFTETVKRAPMLFRKRQLEWLYRLLVQPRRLFRQLALLEYLRLHLSRRL